MSLHHSGNADSWTLPLCDPHAPDALDGVGSGISLAVDLDSRTDEQATALDPFMYFGEGTSISRSICARIVGPLGATVLAVLLEAQRDEYAQSESMGLHNPAIESLWARRWRLWQLASDAGAAPRIVEVLRHEEGEPPRLPATLYCKVRRAFFVPPCPTCSEPLQTCRDDEVLRAHDLPAYAASAQRFLYCRICQSAGREPGFFSLLPTAHDRRSTAAAREQRDLYVALIGPARAGGPLPCAGCFNTASCFPETAGEPPAVLANLAPLSFYDYACFATERPHLTYEQFSAVLGGAPEAEAADGAGEAQEGFERRYGRRRYLFEGDMRGKLPLEILRLKLMLFAQLAGAVSRLHRATGVPHLGLTPATAVIRRGIAAPDVPVLYSFETRVVAIGESLPRRGLPNAIAGDLAVPLLEPPPMRDSTYAGSIAAERVTIHDGVVTVRSLTDCGGGACRVEAELVCESIEAAELVPHDLLVLSLTGRSVRMSIELAVHPERTEGQRIELRSLPLRMDAETVSMLRALIGQSGIRVAFSVYRCLHVAADLQSLGLILFTTLAANSEQGPGTVTAAARAASERVSRFVHDSPAAPPEIIEQFAIGELQRLDRDGVLARRNVFHEPSASSDPALIPDAFWYGALLVGLRALTQTAGFGFCRTRGDFDPAHPEGPVDRLRGELGLITQKLDAELLGKRGMRQVFAAALARVRREAMNAAPVRN